MTTALSVSAAQSTSSVEALLLSSTEIHALTEVGFLASASGDTVRAGMIFEALMRIRPHRAFPYIGMALAWLNAGRPGEAVAVFERAAPVDAGEVPDMAVYHALALQLAMRLGESERILSRIDLRQAPPTIKRLVRSLKGEMQDVDEEVL